MYLLVLKDQQDALNMLYIYFTHISFINHSLSALLAPRQNIYNSFETVQLHFCFEYFVSYYRLTMLTVYTKKAKKILTVSIVCRATIIRKELCPSPDILSHISFIN